MMRVERDPLPQPRRVAIEPSHGGGHDLNVFLDCQIAKLSRLIERRRDRIFDQHGRSEEHTSELQSQFHLVCPPRTTLFPYTTLFRSHAVMSKVRSCPK